MPSHSAAGRPRLGPSRTDDPQRTPVFGAGLVNSSIFQASRDFAVAMDAEDPLASFRERFYFPKTKNGDECVYLCGHSLGLQPKKSKEYVEQELADWAQLNVENHLHTRNPWLPYHRLLTEQTAELVKTKPL